MNPSNSLATKTVADFNDQWERFRENTGWYGSLEMFLDILGPLANVEDFHGRCVVDIGSGTGRIVAWLLACGAREVVAIEPASGACEVLRQNLVSIAGHERVRVINDVGSNIDLEDKADWVVSIGVIHHIPDPAPVLSAAFRNLDSGGRCFLWLYGKEGNNLYLAMAQPLRAITTRIPHWALRCVVEIMYAVLVVYRYLTRLLPLPLKSYLDRVWWPMNPTNRRLVIYDQLNPAYAKYYSKEEAIRLLLQAGFVDVHIFHRHGYSWSVIGTKP